MKLVLRPAVEPEVEAAAEWYEQRQVGLRRKFVAAVDASLERIESNPRTYPRVHRDIHRAPVHGFPYGVSFFVTRDRIEVLAVTHHARHPSIWKRRRNP